RSLGGPRCRGRFAARPRARPCATRLRSSAPSPDHSPRGLARTAPPSATRARARASLARCQPCRPVGQLRTPPADCKPVGPGRRSPKGHPTRVFTRDAGPCAELALSAPALVRAQVALFVLRAAPAPASIVATRASHLADRLGRLDMDVVVVVVAVGPVDVALVSVAAHERENTAARGSGQTQISGWFHHRDLLGGGRDAHRPPARVDLVEDPPEELVFGAAALLEL